MKTPHLSFPAWCVVEFVGSRHSEFLLFGPKGSAWPYSLYRGESISFLYCFGTVGPQKGINIARLFFPLMGLLGSPRWFVVRLVLQSR